MNRNATVPHRVAQQVALVSMYASVNARAVAQACNQRSLRMVQANFSPRLKLLATIFAEYRRAIAAARRYKELKLHRASVVRRNDISRRIFEEFYSRMDGGFPGNFVGGDDATMQCENRSRGPSDGRLRTYGDDEQVLGRDPS